MVDRGAVVTVRGWSDAGENAIAYCSEGSSIGRIPGIDSVENSYAPFQYEKPEMVVFFKASQDHTPGRLGWKARERIRVCKFDNHFRNSGVGFNMVTGTYGKFSAPENSLEATMEHL